MFADSYISQKRVAAVSVLALILAVAAAARLWFLHAGIPHAVGIDEPQVVDRALRILRTGDWNPHIFDYPTLVIYLHAVVDIVRFLWGALNGEWGSLDGFPIAAVYEAGRFVAAIIGVATVWLTYRIGSELSSQGVALLAAAQMAVRPLHVRESHFVLTDVPMTALTTLAVWLSVRAARLGSVRAYAWAGAACGLAAAAKYNGGLVLIAAVAAWLLHERGSADRLHKLGAIFGGAAAGFLAGSPFTLLDLPHFLDGFAAQFARFAVPGHLSEPAWLLYVKHLSPQGARLSVPLAVAGMAIVLWRSGARARWAPAVLFTVAYFYMLSTHSHVFGRYALPLLPMVCLFIAVAVLEIVRATSRFGPLVRLRQGSGGQARPAIQHVLTAAAVILVIYGPAAASVRWLDLQKRSDTRALATEWLQSNTPRGTRLAVENNGPTYLDTAGFKLVASEQLVDHGVDWYRSRADYLIVSAADLARYGEYLGAGPTVFQIAPTLQRWGPPIQIVRLTPPD
jgi:4-amino-4-deoxy-L-arabinose transferase-like glycosyltransferase